MSIYTLGYEKRNIEEYIKMLQGSKIKILIDVREVAWSYKKDFCKVRFKTALVEAGIEYIHIKELGNPKRIRKSGHSSSDILTGYKSYLENSKSGIDSLLNVLTTANESNHNICLTCYERDHKDCHRSVITKYIKPSIDETNIVHL